MADLEKSQCCTVVTGAAGRVGRALRAVLGGHAAGGPILWSARRPGQGIDLVWDIGTDPPPALPEGCVILHLAGQTRGDAAALAENCRSAQFLGKAAQIAQARHVFLMSSVAVYRPEPTPIPEDRPPDPISPYGQAKLLAERALQAEVPADRLTLLRLGNLAGADALLTAARAGPVVLDPIAGRRGGPERSYIGPQSLARTLEALIAAARLGAPLPAILNLAQPPALAMADLLTAAAADWRFGPPRAAALPIVAVSVARLAALVDLPAATAEGMIAELDSLKSVWP